MLIVLKASMRHILIRHKLTVLLGFPVVALIASSFGFSGTQDTLSLSPTTRYVAVGETTHIDVSVHTETPINVVGGELILPPELSLVSVSTEKSIVDLWTKEPSYETGASVPFSGGIIEESGFTGSGVLFSFSVTATSPGDAELLIYNPTVLAHDGKGTVVFKETVPYTIVVRAHGPSPDLTGNNRVGLADIGVMTRALFGAYDARYDFNGDGRVTIADMLILMRNFGGSR